MEQEKENIKKEDIEKEDIEKDIKKTEQDLPQLDYKRSKD